MANKQHDEGYDVTKAVRISLDEKDAYGRGVDITLRGNVRRWRLIDAAYDHRPCKSCDGTGKTDDLDVLDGSCQTCGGTKGTGKTTIVIEIDTLLPMTEEL